MLNGFSPKVTANSQTAGLKDENVPAFFVMPMTACLAVVY